LKKGVIMAKQKYYVVWAGRKTGIFTSWDACESQVNGFKGARFKSFPSKAEAEAAFKADPETQTTKRSRSLSNKKTDNQQAQYIQNSISVDAACSGNPGAMEYRAVYTKTGKEIFHYGPVANGTNNIGEFLAIVHALALLKQKQSALPIYSDSMIAMNWVRKKQARTTIPRDASTEKIWELIDRAHTWLRNNTYPNPLHKWQTKAWGEIKADFGRK